jgi:YesN/AraC family two-component response regulator
LIGGEEDIALIGEACNGREAVDLFQKYQPDITLMDLQMPEMNGIDAIGAIRGEFYCVDSSAGLPSIFCG